MHWRSSGRQRRSRRSRGRGVCPRWKRPRSGGRRTGMGRRMRPIVPALGGSSMGLARKTSAPGAVKVRKLITTPRSTSCWSPSPMSVITSRR